MSDRPTRVTGSRGKALPPSNLGFGMISPANTMVNPDDTPTPIMFRFLAEIYLQLSAIVTRLDDAGIP